MAANGVEIASAYVTLLAKMPGISKSINSAIGSVNTSAASKKIGDTVAAGIGKSLKDQVAKRFAEETAAALDKNTTATKKLADAEHALVKVRAQHGLNSAKVTAAEAKLEKLRVSGKASTAELEGAEASLAKAQADASGTRRAVAAEQNKVAEAKRNATEASKEYADALEKENSKSERFQAQSELAAARVGGIANKWKSAGAQISGIGSSLTSSITKPALGAVGVVGGLATALGFKRLVGIDTAKAQLRGLGFEAAEAQEIIDGPVLDAVEGTAFGIAQAGQAAGGALAAGIKPGAELTRHLKMAGDAAAFSNADYNHMANILTEVEANGYASGGALQQMTDNGLYATSMLADHLGISQEEVKKLASESKITADVLQEALENKIGGAALQMGDTFQGAFANMQAAVGRIGAKIWEDAFPKMRDAFSELTTMMDSPEFAAAASSIGDLISGAFTKIVDGIKGAITWWSQLSPGMQKTIGIAVGVAVAMGPVLVIVGQLATGIGAVASVVEFGIPIISRLNEAMRANPIGAVITAISLLVVGLVWFFTKTKLGQKIWAGFVDFLVGLWEGVKSVAVNLWEGITAAWDAAVEKTKSSWQAVKDFFAGLWQGVKDVFWGAVDFVKTLLWDLNPLVLIVSNWDAISVWFDGFWQGIKDGFNAGVQWVVDLFWNWTPLGLIIQNWDVIAAYFTDLWNGIVSWFETKISQIKRFMQLQMAVIKLVWKRVWGGIKSFFAGVWKWIVSFVQKQANAVRSFVSGAINSLKWIWDKVWGGIKTTVSNVWNWIVGLVKTQAAAVRWAVDTAITTVRTVWESVWGRIRSFFSTVWGKIRDVFDTMIRFVREKPAEAFKKARNLIGDAWEGIKKLARDPVVFVVDTVINGLIGMVNKILPKSAQLPTVSLPAGFADGGWTGPGGKYTPAGVVHADEFVVSKAGRRRFESQYPGYLDHINRTGDMPGFARGGLVTPLPAGSWSTSQPYHGGHNGHDMAAPMGTRVFAAADGKVQLAGMVNMGGNEIYIQHDNGLGTRYSHLSRFATGVGASVKQGHVIGYVGSSGMSTGPHLHYMVHSPGGGGGNYGNHVNPAPYLGLYGKDLGEAGGAASVLDGLVDWAVGKIKKKFPGTSMWVDVASSLAKSVASKMAKAFNPFAASDGHTGHTATLFDRGGVLPVGTTLVANKTREPEYIFTGPQMRALNAAVGSTGGRGSTGSTSYGVSLSGAVKVKTNSTARQAKEFEKLGKTLNKALAKGLRGSVSDVSAAVKSITDGIREAYKSLGVNIAKQGKTVSALTAKLAKEKKAAAEKGRKLDNQLLDLLERRAKAVERGADARKLDRDIAAKRREISLNKVVAKQGSAETRQKRATARAEVKRLKSLQSSKRHQARFAAIVGGYGDRLKVNAKVAAAIQKDLDKAKSTLKDLRAARSDWVKKVASGVTDQGSVSGFKTQAGMVRNFQKRIQNTKAFSAAITKLRKMGLDDLSIRQLTDEFVSSGSPRAAENLVASGATGVKQITSLQRELAKQAAELGKTTGSMLYDSGIRSAEGLVKGLEKSLKRVDKAGVKLAKTLVKAVKRELKIKSPSRVMTALGGFAGQGWTAGVEDEIPAAQAAMRDLVSPPRDLPRATPLWDHGSGVADDQQLVVSLAGAKLTLLVDGRPMEALIEEQLVEATASVSSRRLKTRLGVS